MRSAKIRYGIFVFMRISGFVICLLAGLLPALSQSLTLKNEAVTMRLEVNPDGVPFISEVRWNSGDRLFEEANRLQGMDAWLARDLLASSGQTGPWKQVDHPVFFRAEATRPLRDGLCITWVVDLFRKGSLFRTSVRLTNSGADRKTISWYPVWNGNWKGSGRTTQLHYWQALTFHPESELLADKKTVELGSHLHSSDATPQGQNPYWAWGGEKAAVYFSLDWCGGWRAQLGKATEGNSFSFHVYLPPEETQLALSPGETVEGPVLTAVATRAAEERDRRAEWMAQRLALSRQLYGGPAPSFPFTYNHWYAARFQCNGEFLQRQVECMKPYGFDAFIVDAGWYQAVGQWTPDTAKFRDRQFETILAKVKAGGTRAGLWSCPQFVKADARDLPANAVQPPFYRKFIDGFLLEYAGMDLGRVLLDHTALLRSRYSMDWWKYDQDFFAPQSRFGLMKNVLAWQSALAAVRKAHPDLYLENCQSGGRMINEFTVLITQNQWIRDGGGTGPGHAKSNFLEALGALHILPPWTVNRWTNNPDRNNPDDDEFTRTYCRSAMAGTWGLSADLARIGDRQRDVILAQLAHYRRLNVLKNDCRYEVIYPSDTTPAAGVVYYDSAGTRAGILLLRWESEESLEAKVPLSGLSRRGTFRVEDVDRDRYRTVAAAELHSHGLDVSFPRGRNSALLFLSSEP